MHQNRSRKSDQDLADFSGARGRVARALPVFVAALLCGVTFLWLSPAPADAVPQELQSVELTGQVKVDVDNLTLQAQAVQAEIDTLDTELEQNTEAYNQLRLRLDQLTIDMVKLRRQLKTAQDDHAYRVKKYEDRLCDIYKSGGGNQLLTMVLSAEDAGDLIARVRLAAQQAEQDRQVLADLKESTAKLDALLAQMDAAKAEQLRVREQMTAQKERIDAALVERESTLSGLDSQIVSIIEAERQRQEEEQRRLQEALAAIIAGGQVYSGPLPQTDSEVLNQFLETASYYVGIPYVWAGDRPSTGMDCSGYTAFVYAQHGVTLPHYSVYQSEMGVPVDYSVIQPGDLLAFGFPVHHVGIYIGDDLFTHAAGTGDVIKISVLSERGDLAAIRRFDLQPRVSDPALY